MPSRRCWRRASARTAPAQALGWPKVRVSARVKILELPEPAQQMIGAGVIALSAVDQLRAIGQVSPGLLDAVIAFLADGNEWAAERLAREPGWVLDSALRDGNVKAFAALHEPGERARDLRAAAGEEDRGAVRRGREAAQADRRRTAMGARRSGSRRRTSTRRVLRGC